MPPPSAAARRSPDRPPAEKCGPRAAGKACADPKSCCNKHGWCGTGDAFCAPSLCISGACGSKPAAPPPLARIPRPPPPKLQQQQPQPTKPAQGTGALTTSRAKQGSVAVARCGDGGLAIAAIVAPLFGTLSGGNKCNSTRSYRCGLAGGSAVGRQGCRRRCESCALAGLPRCAASHVASPATLRMPPLARSAVAERCLGKSACSVAANTAVFGEPCRGVAKELSFQFRWGWKWDAL